MVEMPKHLVSIMSIKGVSFLCVSRLFKASSIHTERPLAMICNFMNTLSQVKRVADLL
jgi:hypothetical protein